MFYVKFYGKLLRFKNYKIAFQEKKPSPAPGLQERLDNLQRERLGEGKILPPHPNPLPLRAQSLF